MWLSNGTIQKIPSSKPFTDSDGNYFPNIFPDYHVFNYPIENIRIYVNNKDFLMSKLPQLPKITASYRKGSWDNSDIYYQLIVEGYLFNI